MSAFYCKVTLNSISVLNTKNPLLKIVRDYEQRRNLLSNLARKALTYLRLDTQLTIENIMRESSILAPREIDNLLTRTILHKLS